LEQAAQAAPVLHNLVKAKEQMDQILFLVASLHLVAAVVVILE
jgi:hypothetical protein